MASHYDKITYYGILIPIDYSKQWQFILKKLISKNKKLYNKSRRDIFNFLYALQFQENQSIHTVYNVEDIEMMTLNGHDKPIFDEDILILVGDHAVPNLYSAPFKSKNECIQHYKDQFGDILPENFNYEDHIGMISYFIWA